MKGYTAVEPKQLDLAGVIACAIDQPTEAFETGIVIVGPDRSVQTREGLLAKVIFGMSIVAAKGLTAEPGRRVFDKFSTSKVHLAPCHARGTPA